MSTSRSRVFPKSGETKGDKDDAVFRMCKLWMCVGGLTSIYLRILEQSIAFWIRIGSRRILK